MKDNQHFISKAHLDKFVHPTSKDNHLFPYVKGKGGQRPTGTRRLASADQFFVQHENGTTTNRLDEARQKSENLFFASGINASPLVKCALDDTFFPSASDKFVLAGAAAFLRCGSPVQIHNATMMALFAEQMELFNELNTDEVKANYRIDFGDQADQKLQEAREFVWKGKVFADVGEEHWKQLGLTSFQAEEMWLNALLQMGMTACTCSPKSCFLTSDNPVILTCQSQIDSPGLGLKDADVWFPISYKKGLLWTGKHTGIDKTTLGDSESLAKNKSIIKWCYKDVYAPLPEEWIESAVKENTFDPCYGHYGSLEQAAKAGADKSAPLAPAGKGFSTFNRGGIPVKNPYPKIQPVEKKKGKNSEKGNGVGRAGEFGEVFGVSFQPKCSSKWIRMASACSSSSKSSARWAAT